MKKKLCFLMALLMLLVPGMTGCIDAEVEEEAPDESGGGTDDASLHVYRNTVYVYSTAVNESLLTTDLSPAYLILANKTSALDEQYTPAMMSYIDSQFVTSGDRVKGLQLENTALGALRTMLNEMKAGGVSDIEVTSAYRSYAYQHSLFEYYRELESSTISAEAYAFFGSEYIRDHYTSKGIGNLTDEDALQVVLSYSAAPGTSEHQTGLCVDFVTGEYGDTLDQPFENTQAFAWLQANAYKFGFILRYPKDKVSVTGYSYEPWHYRFVGREAATDIHFSGLCLEEYLERLQ